MSFLQINNPDGTSGIKRPFRLSDIQDIWNGIKSLFKSDQPFRIISGFDLVEGIYESGTVWYDGELYEYDSNTYPITPTTTKVSFGSVAQDDRVWRGGDTRPFALRFICGGDEYSGAVSFTNADFVANIEKYKSYLGDKSVTREKLADSSVGFAQLDLTQRRVSVSRSLRVTQGETRLISIWDLVSPIRSTLIDIFGQGAGVTTINIVVQPFIGQTLSMPSAFSVPIQNQADAEVIINLYESGIVGSTSVLKTFTLPPNGVLILALEDTVLNSGRYFLPVNTPIGLP